MPRPLILLVLALTASLVAACETSESDHRVELPGARDLGMRVVATHADAIAEALDIVAYPAPTAALVRDLDALRRRTVRRMVALANRREDFRPADRVLTDRAVASRLWRDTPGQYEAYVAAAERFRTVTPDVYERLLDLNTVYLYASFDTIRQQLPERAARLGVPAESP